jgi:hypothetical protein
MDIVELKKVEDLIVIVDELQVLVDSDVADLYGVLTKEINQAVSNNNNKFPSGYIIELNKNKKNELVKNFDRFNKLKHSTTSPKAFTEKGLYMLATILKSKQAVETTLAIIETFAKVKTLQATLKELPEVVTKAE